jgi:hydrogenase maturation protein HypF
MGICSRNTFEGEAAMALESCVVDGVQDEYPVELREKDGYTVVDFTPAVNAVANDIITQFDPGMIATRFHNAVASSILAVVRWIRARRGIASVALSGGTFQNRYLLDRTLGLLGKDGIQVFINREVPPNDACISLGQAYLIRERLKKCGAR